MTCTPPPGAPQHELAEADEVDQAEAFRCQIGVDGHETAPVEGRTRPQDGDVDDINHRGRDEQRYSCCGHEARGGRGRAHEQHRDEVGAQADAAEAEAPLAALRPGVDHTQRKPDADARAPKGKPARHRAAVVRRRFGRQYVAGWVGLGAHAARHVDSHPAQRHEVPPVLCIWFVRERCSIEGWTCVHTHTTGGTYATKSLSEADSDAKRLMKEVTWSHDW